jgi:hypothetical protein
MESFNLSIAGYNIRFESADNGPDLIPSERFLSYICHDNNPVVIIRVHSGNFNLPPEAKMVFNAPYIEEFNGIRQKKNDEFWSIFRNEQDLFIRTIFPHSAEKKEAVLHFSLSANVWDLWIDVACLMADPMEYPLDGLILYYLTVIHGDIMIHASGADYDSQGYLFSGVSGKGKTTMAKIWDNSGARIIHDDRLIVRKKEEGYFMFNTPVYTNDVPRESGLDKIFIIEHGIKNEIIPVSGAESVSHIMANCIQHNWDNDIVARLLGSVSIMSESISVARLFFRPDKSIIEFILENG